MAERRVDESGRTDQRAHGLYCASSDGGDPTGALSALVARASSAASQPAVSLPMLICGLDGWMPSFRSQPTMDTNARRNWRAKLSGLRIARLISAWPKNVQSLPAE